MDGRHNSEISSSQSLKTSLISLWVAQVFIWALLPSLLLRNTYVDILENLVWGSHFQWGYDKGPVLAAWITTGFSCLTHHSISSIYWLSQLSVLIGFYAIYKLARYGLPPLSALIAVSLLIAITYYNLGAVEFNDDVLSIPLWALTALFFYRSVNTQKFHAWLLTGLIAGLAFMTKYYAVLLFIPMGLFLVLEPKARLSFRKPGFYGAATLFALISAPHLIWVYQHHFISFRYALARGNINSASFFQSAKHLINPLDFIIAEFGMILPAGLLFGVCFPELKFKKPADRDYFLFISLIGWGPFVLYLLFSIITASYIHSSWGAPLFNWLGIFLVLILQPQISIQSVRRFLKGIILFSLLWVMLFLWGESLHPYWKKYGRYEHFPGQAVALSLTQQWHSRYHTRLAYVIGDRLLTVNLACQSPDHPEAYFKGNQQFSPWIDEKELKEKGALLIWKPALESSWINSMVKRFPDIEIQHPQAWIWSIPFSSFLNRYLKPLPNIELGFAFLPPPNPNSQYFRVTLRIGRHPQQSLPKPVCVAPPYR